MIMKRVLTGLAAGTAMLGLVALPTGAQAFVPAVAAVIAGGALVGGATLGAATTQPYAYPYAYGAPYGPAYAQAVPPAPTVERIAPACYYTHARLHGIWRRVRVCP
jgi:hypothetical protein